MAIARNAATGEVVEPRCVIDGADIMDDAMGDGGVEVAALADEEARRLAGQGDANLQGWDWWKDWWKRWVMREEWKRRVMREERIGDWWRDWETTQDAQEEALGIG